MCDLAGIDVQFISLIDMVVDHRCQEVVCRADRVEIACEVEVDVLHGNDLSVSAAGSAALDTEDRSEGGLAQSDHYLLAELLQAVSESDCRRCLSFSCRCGVHRCHKDQLAVLPVGILQKLVVDLSLILAVLFQIFVTDACLCRDLSDRKHLTFLRDFDITLVSHSFLLNFVLIHCILFNNHSAPKSQMLRIRGCKKGSNGNLAVSAPLPITAQTVDFFTISGSHVVLHKPVSNRKPLFYTHVITKL